MNFNQLENFLCVCEENNITKAAHKLYISQSALSQQISRLEQEVGAPLFARNGNMLHLLPGGSVLQASARRILNEYDQAINSIHSLNFVQTSSALNVAIVKPRAFLLMSYILPRFNEIYPDIQIIVNEVDRFEVEPLLLSGTADLGFCNPPEYMPLKKNLIFNEQLLVAVPPDHPINQAHHEHDGRYPIIRPEELNHQPFIMQSADSSIFQYAQEFFKTYKLMPKIRTVTHVGEHIHFLTAAGLGLSFVFELSISLQATYQNPPVYYSLPHKPYSKPWYLACGEKEPEDPNRDLFTAFNVKCFQKYPFGI